LNPNIGPPTTEPVTWKERFVSVTWLAPILIILVVMFGGIYLGVFSPIEAAAVGAFTVFIVVLARRSLKMSAFKASMANMARTSAMIFLVIIGAMIFNKFLVLSGVPDALSAFVSSLPVPRLVILVIVLIIYIILGMFMNVPAMLAITLPIFFPLLNGLGYDGVFLGILIVLEVEMAAISPPLAMNVYVLKAVVGDLVSLGGIFRGILPFLLVDIFICVLLVAFPQISLWLPSTMFK